MIQLLKIIKSDLNPNNELNFSKLILKFLFNMSFRLILNYRLGHFLNSRRNIITNIFILWLKKRQIKRYSCDISYHSKIGVGIKFPHPIGIVIGVGAVIKNNVMIWQNVTLGSSGKSELSYPTIENNVKLYSCCQVLGSVTIGKNAKVGASSVVLSDIPENKTAVGIPSKII